MTKTTGILHTKLYEFIQLYRGLSRKWSEILKSNSIENWNELIRLKLFWTTYKINLEKNLHKSMEYKYLQYS